jgi:hypothetical protein
MELKVSISEVMELTELPVTCVFWREKMKMEPWLNTSLPSRNCNSSL